MKAVLAFCIALSALVVRAGGYGVKYIAVGWDLGRADPRQVLAAADRFDRLAIDGVAMSPKARQDGDVLDPGWIMTDPPWRYESFAADVPTFRKIASHRALRESFLACGMSARRPEGRKNRPGGDKPRIALGDDAAWGRVARNFGVLARVAREGGLAGLLVDNEDYHGTHQFDWMAEDGDFDAACALMRRRGRQVFGEVFREFPRAKLLFFWAFSNVRAIADSSPDPVARQRSGGCERRMLPHFLNGLLDVMPPEALLIDGNEDSYSFRAADGDFERAYRQVLNGVMPFVAPENRAKYRAQVRGSFGLYLDQYVGAKYRTRAGKRGVPNNWYRPPVNGSRDAGFRADLEAATLTADEYVWIYGERFAFVDWGHALDGKAMEWNAIFARQTWNEHLGLDAKLRMAKAPEAFLARALSDFAADPAADNIFSRTKARRFPSVTAFDVAEQVSADNRFAVSVEVRDAVKAPTLRWRKGSNWNWPEKGVRHLDLVKRGEKDGWSTFTAFLKAPAGADNLQLQLAKDAQFRNAALYRLDPPPSRPFRLAYQLDVSRCKIPKTTDLKRIVDILAACGYRELQLYMELAFAYAGYEHLWKDVSPLTPDEVRDLSAYCRSKGIDLVPSQNSFAHMGPWFEDAALCRRLAECPGGVIIDTPRLKKRRGPVTLTAASGESKAFLAGLYDQLLPCFDSRYFNIGCDEVYDLLDVNCRSAAKMKKEGYARTYFDHVLMVRSLARLRQRESMFWADAIFEYPELQREIPKDMIALVYAYEKGAVDKFEAKCAALEGHEVRFYTCPGTSGWCGPSGRTASMMGNVKEAFEAGRRHGAEGMMVYDWGDAGNHEPWIVALPSIAYAASLARGKELSRAGLAAELDRICGAKVGESLLRYGDIWENTPYMRFLFNSYAGAETNPVPAAVFSAWREAAALADFKGAPAWVRDDFAVMDFLYGFLEARQSGRLPPVAELEKSYRDLWLRHNREGGMTRSFKCLRKKK